MEIVDGEVLLISRLGIIAMGNVEDVVSDVLFDHKPRSATKPHTLSLTDGMKPQTLMLPDTLARLQFDDIARLLT